MERLSEMDIFIYCDTYGDAVDSSSQLSPSPPSSLLPSLIQYQLIAAKNDDGCQDVDEIFSPDVTECIVYMFRAMTL